MAAMTLGKVQAVSCVSNVSNTLTVTSGRTIDVAVASGVTVRTCSEGGDTEVYNAGSITRQLVRVIGPNPVAVCPRMGAVQALVVLASAEVLATLACGPVQAAALLSP